jgi:hypothetical protein
MTDPWITADLGRDGKEILALSKQVFFSLVVLILALCAAIPPAYAVVPGWRGYTGLMIVPTADANMKGEWSIGLWSEDVSEVLSSYAATYGLLDNFEIGIDRFKPSENDDTSTLLNLKYEFFRTCPEQFGVAAGVIDLTDDFKTTVYVVGSMSLITKPPVWYGEVLAPRIHLGFAGGTLDGLFGGISHWFGNRVQVTAEWDSVNINVGGKFRITPELTIYGGGFNLSSKDNPGLAFDDQSTFGAGISYNYAY